MRRSTLLLLIALLLSALAVEMALSLRDSEDRALSEATNVTLRIHK